MKKAFVFFSIILFSLNGFSEVINGVQNIDSAVKSFFDPLKKGSKNIDDAMANIPSLNGEARQYAEKDVKNKNDQGVKGKLYQVMATEQGGGVMEYKEIDSKSKLNGAYVTKTYQVRFRGGQVKTMKFKFLRPTTGPEYEFVDAEMHD